MVCTRGNGELRPILNKNLVREDPSDATSLIFQIWSAEILEQGGVSEEGGFLARISPDTNPYKN